MRKLRLKLLRLMFDYHHYLGDFYLNRINNSELDKDGKYWGKLKHHAAKEFEIVERIYAIEGI